jgi:hypothetical protein
LRAVAEISCHIADSPNTPARVEQEVVLIALLHGGGGPGPQAARLVREAGFHEIAEAIRPYGRGARQGQDISAGKSFWLTSW